MQTKGVAVAQRVFISYSAADREFVDRLAAHLSAAGIDSWHDADQLRAQGLHAQVQQQIEDSFAFIVVMSPESLASESVNNELYLANAWGKTVVPVLLRGEVFVTLRNSWPLDAIGGSMPGDALVNRLRAAIAGPSVVAPVDTPATPTVSMPSVPEQREAVSSPAPLLAAQNPPSSGESASQPVGQPSPPPASPATLVYQGGMPPTFTPPGPSPAPTPAPRRRRALIVGVVALIVLVLAGAVATVVYLRVSNTPKAAVNSWFTSLKGGDLQAVRDKTCAQYKADITDTNLNDTGPGSISWNITELTQSGDSAVATIEVSFVEKGAPRHETVKFAVVKEDGRWKVCGPAPEVQSAR